jgi:hypothetical protein
MYVARDKDGTLCVFFSKPVKGYFVKSWKSVSLYLRDYFELDSSLFPEVSWEDEEPTEVELVKKL